jgi:hypothetical protein
MPFITNPARQEFRKFMASSPLMAEAASLGNIAVSDGLGHGQSAIDPVQQIAVDLRVLNGLIGDVADFGHERHVAEALDTASDLRSRVHEVIKSPQAQSIERTLNEVIRICKRPA